MRSDRVSRLASIIEGFGQRSSRYDGTLRFAHIVLSRDCCVVTGVLRGSCAWCEAGLLIICLKNKYSYIEGCWDDCVGGGVDGTVSLRQ